MPRIKYLHLLDPTADRVLKGPEFPIPEESETPTRPEQRIGEVGRLTFEPEIRGTGKSPERR